MRCHRQLASWRGYHVLESSEFSKYAPKRLVAQQLKGPVGRGNSVPLHMRCVDDTDQTYEVVVKLLQPGGVDGRPWPLCLVRDLVGTILARKFGLEVPDYAIVTIDQRFAATSLRHPEGGRLQRNVGEHFGSIMIPFAVEETGVLRGSVDAWETMIGFDALSYNGDRMGGNPNALWDGTKLYAIDHGSIVPSWAFPSGTTSISLYPDLWAKTHAGRPHLEGRKREYDQTAKWGTLLTESFLDWLRTQVPASWAPCSDVDQLFSFIRDRQAIATKQQDRLKGLMR